jgi:putative ABC transport system substrate-binding protein
MTFGAREEAMRRREFITLLGGAAAGWPRAARAQQLKKIPTIGALWHAGSAEEEGPYYRGLADGFKALGYIGGRNIAFEHRFPNEIPEQFKSMAAEIVSLNVDVMVGVGDHAAVYLRNASSTIPLIFVLVPDPIGSKLVDSFAHPGRNATGVSNYSSDVIERRLQLLKDVIPGLSRVAQLVNPNAPISRLHIEATRAAAAVLGLTHQTFDARSLNDLAPAFDAMESAGMEAVTVNASEGIPFQGRVIIAKLALERRLALCAFTRETFEPGALMSYGVDHVANVRRGSVYVDKILRGAKPAELPVEGPTKFEFLLNLRTAKALGIRVRPDIPTIADEVIE